MVPETVQVNPMLLEVPVAVRHTVAPPPLPQLCAWLTELRAENATNEANTKTVLVKELMRSPLSGCQCRQRWPALGAGSCRDRAFLSVTRCFGLYALRRVTCEMSCLARRY